MPFSPFPECLDLAVIVDVSVVVCSEAAPAESTPSAQSLNVDLGNLLISLLTISRRRSVNAISNCQFYEGKTAHFSE